MAQPTSLPQSNPYEYKLAYRVDEAVRVSGLGRTTIYAAIKEGQLKAIKVAGRRLILRRDLEAFLGSGASAT